MSENLKENQVVTKEELSYTEQIVDLIKQNHDKNELSLLLSDYHVNDIADALVLLEDSEREKVYSALSDEQLSDIFAHIENPSEIIEDMPDEKVADIIEEMASDDAIDLLEELDEEKQKEILELLDDETARDVELITAYEEDCVGSIMTNDFVVIKNTFNIKEAMNSLISQAENCENITIIYVTDEKNNYYGAIELKDLFIARADLPLENIIATSYPCFSADLKIADVIEKIKDYSEESLPVVDKNNKLIGALTGSNVVEAVQSEMEEDYAKLAGLSESASENSGVFKNLAIRLPWLIILLGLGMLVSSMIATFDHVIALLPLLAFFQPMILGMSGNAGTQALGVTIRNLSQSNEKSSWKKVWRETAISFINGLFLAVISFILLGLYITFFKDMPMDRAFTLSFCIGFALAVSMTVSGFCGSAVPIVFKKLGIDPSAASGPLITTASDLVSALTYYGLVSLIINFFI